MTKNELALSLHTIGGTNQWKFSSLLHKSKILVGLTITVNLVIGTTLLYQLIVRLRFFVKKNHRKLLATMTDYRQSLDDAAAAAAKSDAVMDGLLWHRLCRILSNFIYFFLALATLSIIRITGRQFEVSEFFDDGVRITIFGFMIVSAVVIAANIYEINRICKGVLEEKTGSERGF